MKKPHSRRARAALLIMMSLAIATSTGCTEEILLAAQLASANNKIQVDQFLFKVPDSKLVKIRTCESKGNYQAVSKSGTYRGAYQFSQKTWNGIAKKYYPEVSGLDPAAASPADQDIMARALYATAGPGQWPICGR